MNLTGRLRRCGANFRRPGPDFLGPCREKCLQAKQSVTAANDAIETRLIKTKIFEKYCLVLVFEHGNLGFNRCTDRNNLCAFGFCMRFNDFQVRVVLEAALIDICDIHDRFDRDQV